ncbi:JmjC domain-containing protein, partial [Patulibacter sp. S7RM1-6]
MIEIDPTAFAAAYDAAPLRVAHRVQDDPLLRIDALVALAETHPEELVEHNLGAVPLELPGGEAPRLGRSGAQVLAEIAENGSWLVLKNVERDARYRALLDRLLDAVDPLVPGGEDTHLLREAFVFVSAPDSVTPAHVDPEHNFLLQIRGSKVMHVGAFDDDETRARELERFHSGSHRNIERVPDALEPVELTPGQGVYVPPDAPHWVQNGPEVSISLSITWRTPTTSRRGRLWAANHRLRQRGRTPALP